MRAVEMIKGIHTMFYSSKAEELRAFLRDKLGLPCTDVGEGWLIFDLPEAEMGCHPAEGKEGCPAGTHNISFYCDDIQETVRELKQRGVEFIDEVADHSYGLATHFKMPGEVVVQLYQPKYRQRPKSTEQPTAQFTPRAQQVLALARKEADRLNHNFIGTEHVLLGLLALGTGVAVNVLLKLGLSLEKVRQEVLKQVGPGPDRIILGNIPYTPRVKKVLALAAKEARTLNHTYVGTEHILLGLLGEGDGPAARVLQNLGVQLPRTRQEILKELDPNAER